MRKIKGPSEIGQQLECCSLQQMTEARQRGAVRGAKSGEGRKGAISP